MPVSCVIFKTRMERVRFAPSPTGHLHLGAAHTALFNWLYARCVRGVFILRIEDTDTVRSSEPMTLGIIRSLEWLGLDWDEGPVYQSKRIKVYRKKAEELVRNGKAYPCYCTPQEIQERKRDALKAGNFISYDRRCLQLSDKDRERLESKGTAKAIRFLVPEIDIHYFDLIHGSITVKSEVLEDFVLLRSDGIPTYHLSVVVDDIEQGITLILRGDDHISNSPKQILLYEAFGYKTPEFAHMPLILGPDKKKLSKRHGVTSILQFKENGYLPLSVLNFLAQMSWSPGPEERIYTIEEMIENFSLKKLSKGSPVFDLHRLEWLNGRLLSQMKPGEIALYIKEELKKEALWSKELEGEKKIWFFRVLNLLKERSRIHKDFIQRGRPFLSDDFEYEKDAVEKYLSDDLLEELLPKLARDIDGIEPFSPENIEDGLRKRAETEGVKAALFIHALRVLVLGMRVSPGIFEVLELIGKKKTIERIARLKDVKKSYCV